MCPENMKGHGLLGELSVMDSAKGWGWKDRPWEIVEGLHAMQKSLNCILFSGEPVEDLIREVVWSNLHFIKVTLAKVVKNGKLQWDSNKETR